MKQYLEKLSWDPLSTRQDDDNDDYLRFPQITEHRKKENLLAFVKWQQLRWNRHILRHLYRLSYKLDIPTGLMNSCGKKISTNIFHTS